MGPAAGVAPSGGKGHRAPVRSAVRPRTPHKSGVTWRVRGMGERGRLRLQSDESPAPPPDAEELLRQVAAGDETAFSALYDLVAGPVLGLATRVLRSHAQAEEVTQEVLVEVWRK